MNILAKLLHHIELHTRRNRWDCDCSRIRGMTRREMFNEIIHNDDDSETLGVYNVWSDEIVLNLTVLKDMPMEMIVAVISHETLHMILRHTISFIAGGRLNEICCENSEDLRNDGT